jgi:hypothetical protein
VHQVNSSKKGNKSLYEYYRYIFTRCEWNFRHYI